MHGTTGPSRKRGRPKAILQASVAYPDMSRREREHHRTQLAERLNDTDASAAESHWDIKIASLALEPYGIQLVPNEDPDQTRALHIHQEWPQGVRRKISGSVWDGRKLIWRKPTVRDYTHKLGKLTNRPKVRCAHRSWKSAHQMIAAARQPLEQRGVDPAAADAMLAAIGHLARPQTRRSRTYLDEGVNKLIKAKRDLDGFPPKPWLLYWGAPGATAARLWLEGPPSGFVVRAGIEGDLAMLAAGEAWWAQIGAVFSHDDPYEDDPAAKKKPPKTFLFRPGTAPLQRPDISRDAPFRAVARLWNWQINNRRREQMAIPWPKFAFHGECYRVDHNLPRAFPGDRGGQCCRWICGGFKTCPLQCWRRQK